jgi:hypothetical protein
MRASSIAISEVPLTQAQIMDLQITRVLAGGEPLDAVLFKLRLGEAPIPELGGSGFRLDTDPPQGVRLFAHAEMQRLLAEARKMKPRLP